MAIETEWIAEIDMYFARTPEYYWFEEFVQACGQYRYIGLCVGRPGVGKTWSARYLSGWESLISQVQTRMVDPIARVTPSVAQVCQAVLYTVPTANTPRLLREDLAYRFDVYSQGLFSLGGPPQRGDPSVPLLLVDEADRLTTPSLEYLRDLYDRLGFGLVLLGSISLEKRVKRYAQLYSRVGFSHQFRSMSRSDLIGLLEQQSPTTAYPFKHPPFADEAALLAAVQLSKGNLRQLVRVFEQVERLALINQQPLTTVALLELAGQTLVMSNVE